MTWRVEAMQPSDWPFVRAIHEEGIATGNATFELEPAASWEQWSSVHLPEPRLVARDGTIVIGWAALSRASSREAYRGVVEVSVYVAKPARGRGAGRRLLEKLIDLSESEGLWTLQASIFPENEESVRLHLACGFRLVGRRERIGMLHGVWRDTVLLERRSNVVGSRLV